MRSYLSMMALVAGGVMISAPTMAEGFADHGTVKATRSGGKVTIVVSGKGDWRVNTEYPIKVELGGAKLSKGDAKYGGEKNGKAESATFETGDAANSGSVKAVFCDASSCTAPLKTSFDVK
ncbi:MAG: hypothetical protein FJ096_02720 [Deltaproteobacteria bacterium]|nr:hypothetical protein [Deltaproteobacteria bacterium]